MSVRRVGDPGIAHGPGGSVQSERARWRRCAQPAQPGERVGTGAGKTANTTM